MDKKFQIAYLIYFVMGFISGWTSDIGTTVILIALSSVLSVVLFIWALVDVLRK